MGRRTVEGAESASASVRRSPAIIAIERMDELAASGTNPNRMGQAVEDVLIHWKAEGLASACLQERIKHLQKEVGAGYEAAQDSASCAVTPAAHFAAVNQMVALKAVQSRLATIVSD